MAQTFVQILEAIKATGLLPTAASIWVYITREAYQATIDNSSGLVSYINLPYYAVNLTDFIAKQSNYPPNFQFTIDDLTVADDWVVFNFPF